MLIFLQSERATFGRQYSDEEDEIVYREGSELMATPLAQASGSAPEAPRRAAAPKVERRGKPGAKG